MWPGRPSVVWRGAARDSWLLVIYCASVDVSRADSPTVFCPRAQSDEAGEQRVSAGQTAGPLSDAIRQRSTGVFNQLLGLAVVPRLDRQSTTPPSCAHRLAYHRPVGVQCLPISVPGCIVVFSHHRPPFFTASSPLPLHDLFLTRRLSSRTGTAWAVPECSRTRTR